MRHVCLQSFKTTGNDREQIFVKKYMCALNLISTFVLLSLARYFCWWTISPRGYHPPSSRCFGTVMVY